MGLEHGSDKIAIKTVGPRECEELVVLPVRETAACADPERAVVAGKKGADEVIGQAVSRGVGFDDPCALDMVQAIGRANPYTVVGSRRRCEDDLAFETCAGRKTLGVSGLPAVQAVAVGADPHGAVRSLRDGGNHMIG